MTPNRLSALLAERRGHCLPVIDLTESNPTRCGFITDAQGILAALAHPRGLTYEPDPRGLLSARQAVAAYYAERGVQVTPEQIFLTTSTSEAYSYVFRLLADPGDNILVPHPSYPLFDFLARLNDVELVPYPLIYDHGWQIDLQMLVAHLNSRTRAVLVVHPNNPTGSFAHRREVDFLIDCCRKQQLALIADEVFADYAFASVAPDFSPAHADLSLRSGQAMKVGATGTVAQGLSPAQEDAAQENRDMSGNRVLSFAAQSAALTFTLSGLSKISALPQMKLAWVIVNGPEHLLHAALARLEVIADTYLSLSAPLAHALPELLEVRRHVQPQILNRLRQNLGWLDEQLSPACPVRRLETEGAWYVILRMPAVRNDEEWAVELLRQDGVLVHPGHFYDFSAEGHLVLSLLPAAEVFQRGVLRILAHAMNREE